VNLPSILSTIVNSPQLDVSQVDNGQQSNSGMSFDQQLAAQTEKLNQQASTIQTSESKSTDSNQAQSQDTKLTAKAANDADEKNTDNSEIVEAMAGMAVAPSLLSGINLAAKVIDHLTSSDKAAKIEDVSTASGVSGNTKSSMADSTNTAINTIAPLSSKTDSTNTAINIIATLSSTEANSAINAGLIATNNAQDTSKRLPEPKAMMDVKAFNEATQDSFNQANKMNMTGFTPETMGSEVTSDNDLQNAITQNTRNSVDNRAAKSDVNLLASNLVDAETQLAELKASNSLKVSNSLSAAASSQKVLASDLALDTTNQNISVNNIGNNLRTIQVDSVNVVELKPPVSSPDWGPALNQRITWMVANSLQNASITVNPPNLGPLEINIQTDQNKTNVQFIVTSSEVRQAIQDSIPALNKMFENSGLQLGQADINSRSYNQNRENAKTDAQIKNIEIISNQVEAASIQGQGLINTYV
jgi:flagellar hook-length control protein FliK